jgi:hypothetical protein
MSENFVAGTKKDGKNKNSEEDYGIESHRNEI